MFENNEEHLRVKKGYVIKVPTALVLSSREEFNDIARV